jgi:hypothetical protein
MESASTDPTQKLWLTPPERWFASWALTRQRTHRTPVVVRLETNYGPRGIAIMGAALLLFFTGWIVCMVGSIFLYATRTNDPAAYYVIYVGIALELLTIIRCVQGVRVGRRYRGNRPMLK